MHSLDILSKYFLYYILYTVLKDLKLTFIWWITIFYSHAHYFNKKYVGMVIIKVEIIIIY